MELKKWKYVGVNKQGKLPGGGLVETIFTVKNSIENGCRIESCKCIKEHWISINFGRQKNGSVYGLTYYFTSKKEQSEFVYSN